MNAKTLNWLLEQENPSMRYFTMRYLLSKPEGDSELKATGRVIMSSEPVQKILAAQKPEGFWVKAGHGYSPKYQATSWQILFLAELGADGNDERIRCGCEYLITHAQSSSGGFSAAYNAAPSGAIHCLNGNLIWALNALGYTSDSRLEHAVDWMAGSITGEDFAGWNAVIPGPGFSCGANYKLPCAWGAVKALRALETLPSAMQTPKVKQAIKTTVEFLFSRDPAKADYPYHERVNGEWFKFGFPLSYTSDILELSLALCEAGYGRDPRLKNASDLILSERQPDGRWLLKHSLNGKMWADIEVKGKPSKWITLRALRVLKASGIEM